MPENIVTLRLDGKKISGWTSISINRSLDNLADSFDLSMVDAWEGEVTLLKPEVECTIFIDEKKVLTGYIDKVGIPIDATNRNYTVSGRSKTQDLIDCSADNQPGSWEKVDVLYIVGDLVHPYGIEVFSNIDFGEPVKKFSINTGESPFEAIQRICQDRGVLCITDVDGNLLLSTAGEERADDNLILGQNVLFAEASYEFSNRFKIYKIKSQKSGEGDSWEKSNTQIYGEAQDDGIIRNRIKVIAADSQMSNALAQKRAAWEAQTRAGRSGVITVKIPSWYQSKGNLWEPNFLVACQIAPLRLSPDSPLLINEVNYSQDDSGTVCTLKMVRKDAYAAEPQKVTKTKEKKKTFGFGW